MGGGVIWQRTDVCRCLELQRRRCNKKRLLFRNFFQKDLKMMDNVFAVSPDLFESFLASAVCIDMLSQPEERRLSSGWGRRSKWRRRRRWLIHKRKSIERMGSRSFRSRISSQRRFKFCQTKFRRGRCAKFERTILGRSILFRRIDGIICNWIVVAVHGDQTKYGIERVR